MDGRVTPELLARLLDEHGPALTLFASQWTEAPEDCVQEALFELVRQPAMPDRVVPWLYRVVRNRAISDRRSKLRRARHETAAATERKSWFTAPPSALVDEEQLTRSLQLLADDLREVIVARIWGGLSFEQIADVVGTSRSSAHRRYEQGLSILRERLGIACTNRKTETN